MDRKLTTPKEVGFDSARLSLIKPAMQAYVDQNKIAGIVTLLARQGKVVHFEQVGWQDREAHQPMKADTIFRIYSMTKPVICTALMMLYERNLFKLTDPVANYIPTFGSVKVLENDGEGGTKLVEPRRPVTVRDLLTHTSGLTYHFLVDSPVSELYRQNVIMQDFGLSLQKFIEELSRLPLAYQPGTRFQYSQGIDVAAALIEILAGMPLGQFLQERFFGPLGMLDTGFYVPPEKQARLAAMYGLPDIGLATTNAISLWMAWQNGVNERLDVEKTHPSTLENHARGGYGLFSTAWDYLRFAQMLLQGGELDGVRLLGRKTLELMHSNHLPASLLPYEIGGMPSYGYGFGLGSRVLMNVAEAQMPGSVGSYGWGGAAKTDYWVDSKEKMVGVFMSQAMMSFEIPDIDFRVLAYSALVD
jgi:CubicO group peptidase (beta-lactamase class C family)